MRAHVFYANVRVLTLVCVCFCASARFYTSVCVCGCGRLCALASVRAARMVGLHACASPSVCGRVNACECAFFRECVIMPGFRRLGKKITNNPLTESQTFLCINYNIFKPFLWYLNLFYNIYGISMLSLCRYAQYWPHCPYTIL